MRKLLHIGMFVLPFAFSGCYFTVTAAMCDQIRSDPNKVVPQECKKYDEKAAEKASTIKPKHNDSEIIKFAPAEDK
ncbi:hypothetical protein [Sulfurimonas sp. HSL-1716]|uniref:hypothetical protein n=1 Tax=Hydrocurvibacter sulfurireducens TaxID=3131937 RepID=UPI0031F9E936